MASIRVTVGGRSYTFPPGATVSIGSARDCDVILSSPAVGRRHSRLIPDGDGWRLVGDERTAGIWVAGRQVSSLPLTGAVTAHLGDPHGTAEIRFELVDGSVQAAEPVLVTRLGRDQRIFPAGQQVRVGRDPSLELVSVNPLVSRRCHGLITSDKDGATYTDRSRRGTFLNGKRLRRPLRITDSVVLRLADPATGEELGITPPLSSTRLARNHGRRVVSGRVRAGALAAAAVALAVGLTTAIISAGRTPAPASSAPASSAPVSALS